MQMAIKNYRLCAGIVLLNQDNQVFVGERIDTPGAWQMPQGGIDPGETIERAAYRELQEETGIGSDSAKIIKVADENIKYDLPEHLLQKLWNGKYQGQEQTWVAMRFNGNDSEINLKAHYPPEFSKWQWVDLHQTLDLIVPFKRDTYLKVISMFESIITT